ncbi:hypothetical protein CRN61_06835 [Vibrio vulnificus]|uniref:hypothetical protein n=1 Tax=Vibrio vulnificus TaxID=672 RepID=UPI000C9EB1D0|nr:hypothetical protein [Vibrio vulnificus]PNG63274.1 hypothetical protein SC81_17590 [Vibrio vulnificus]POC10410.1 hypothetical protein CRN54_11240 [Vibrio vulnificus]POC80093.1 hypothetical protein CRN61_06835 [Vibrio vulnificus]
MSDEVFWQKSMQFSKDYPIVESNYFVDFLICNLWFDEWLKTTNPDHLDRLVAYLAVNQIPIKGILLSELGALSASRLIREEFAKNHMRTKPSKSFKQEWDYSSFVKVLKLIIWCDVPLYKACELVTQWRDKQDINLSSQKKASSLEKEFSTWRKNNQHEENLIRNPPENADCYDYQNWTNVQKKRAISDLLGGQFGEAPDRLKGNRRD